MNQLKISTRLAVAFAVMVLLLVALGLWAWYGQPTSARSSRT